MKTFLTKFLSSLACSRLAFQSRNINALPQKMQKKKRYRRRSLSNDIDRPTQKSKIIATLEREDKGEKPKKKKKKEIH